MKELIDLLLIIQLKYQNHKLMQLKFMLMIMQKKLKEISEFQFHLINQDKFITTKKKFAQENK